MRPSPRAGGGPVLLLAMTLASCSGGKPTSEDPPPAEARREARPEVSERTRGLGLSMLRRHAPPGATFEIRSAALLQGGLPGRRRETFHFTYLERWPDGHVRAGTAILRSEDDGRRFVSFWRREEPATE
jgi:hypothetical protein